jgi:hypothetical protein
MGKVMCVGKKIQYFWDGTSLKHQSGDNIGQATWNGLTLTWTPVDAPPVVYHWNQCVSEFQSAPDDEGEIHTIWIWNKEGFVKSTPSPKAGQQPKLWKFLTPIPPPVILCIDFLSVTLTPEVEQQPEPVAEPEIESAAVRRERRRKNKISHSIRRPSSTLRAASLGKIFRNKPSKADTAPMESVEKVVVPEIETTNLPDSKSDAENKFARSKSKSPRRDSDSRSPRSIEHKKLKKKGDKETKPNFDSESPADDGAKEQDKDLTSSKSNSELVESVNSDDSPKTPKNKSKSEKVEQDKEESLDKSDKPEKKKKRSKKSQ